MKKCFKCNIEKPLSDFYIHKMMSDGHLGKCKSCTKIDSTNHRNNTIDACREYDKRRGSRQTADDIKQYRLKFPKKYKAHNIINNALRDGKISKEPCIICGNYKTVAHHDDYNKPHDIRWMCQMHHVQWHRDNGEGLNPF